MSFWRNFDRYCNYKLIRAFDKWLIDRSVAKKKTKIKKKKIVLKRAN